MSGPADAPAGRDLAAEVRRAIAFLEHPPTRGLEPTSDLTIDEELIVHSIGWEPVELVSGLSMVSIPWSATLWSWGQGAITPASSAYETAFGAAIARMHGQAAEAGGHGVVGVTVERAVHASFVEITLTGTAVRPIGAPAVPPDDIFVSDLVRPRLRAPHDRRLASACARAGRELRLCAASVGRCGHPATPRPRTSS